MGKRWQATVSVVATEYSEFTFTKPASATTEYREFRTTILVDEIEGESPEETALEEALAQAMAKREEEQDKKRGRLASEIMDDIIQGLEG